MGAWSGFYNLPLDERAKRIGAHGGLSRAQLAAITAASALPPATAEAFVENVTGAFPLPLGWLVNLQVDGATRIVPMAIEESSVVAAACKGAKLAGNIVTSAMDPITIGQIELRQTPADIATNFSNHKAAWISRLNAEIPSMVARGGGVRNITLREIAPSHHVVHILVDTRDSMGANLVNTLCESIGPNMAHDLQCDLGLQILSNLATERLVRAECRISLADIGSETADSIIAANRFAVVDPYRAATHNKGIMNGIEPVAIATGNDWRAISAGAHSYAAFDGQYRSLTDWRLHDGELVGVLTLPLSVGTVGGVTKLHPVADACLKVLGRPTGPDLARIMAAVGLAQNLAALLALATEGIQKGHMALHESNRSLRA